MHFKRFEAPDSRTALKMVKEQLGDEAVILSNKTVHNGTPYQRVEVVAAMDYDLESITFNKDRPAPEQHRTTSPVVQSPRKEKESKPAEAN